MYGANIMDGKLKVFTLQDLVESTPKMLKETHFVETSYGVVDSEYFAFGPGSEYIVSGLDDGTVSVYDYTQNKGNSYSKPVFRIQKDKATSAVELDNPYDQFVETLYEHSDSVTKIEKNFRDNNVFMSCGKDS